MLDIDGNLCNIQFVRQKNILWQNIADEVNDALRKVKDIQELINHSSKWEDCE